MGNTVPWVHRSRVARAALDVALQLSPGNTGTNEQPCKYKSYRTCCRSKKCATTSGCKLAQTSCRTCWLLVVLKASAMWQEDRFAQEKISAIFELCCRISLAGRLIHKPRHKILLIADKREKDRLLGPERNQELRRLLIEQNR